MPKPGSVENNPLFGRTPLGLGLSPDIPLLFKSLNKIRRKKKKKHTFFRKRRPRHAGRAAPATSLHALGEVLGEDAAAPLQLLVLVPVALLDAHEPAFILGHSHGHGAAAGPSGPQGVHGPPGLGGQPLRPDHPSSHSQPTARTASSREPSLLLLRPKPAPHRGLPPQQLDFTLFTGESSSLERPPACCTGLNMSAP